MLFNLFGKRKIGLALSGGGARGLAHIGVLKVLHDNRIPIDFISGTSVGSLVGALYAGGMNMTTMLEIGSKVKWKNFFRIVLCKTGLVSSEEIEKFIISQIGNKTFADMNIPFSTNAVDLKTGNVMTIDKGDVARAVRISCSFPWMYIPIKENDSLLVEGVLVNNLPAKTVRMMGADFVIGVDVIPRTDEASNYENVLEIFDRALDIFIIDQHKKHIKDCDIVITPVKQKITSLELDRAQELILLGEEAAKAAMPEIKKALSIF